MNQIKKAIHVNVQPEMAYETNAVPDERKDDDQSEDVANIPGERIEETLTIPVNDSHQVLAENTVPEQKLSAPDINMEVVPQQQQTPT